MSSRSLCDNVCRTCLREDCQMKSLFNTEEFIEPPLMLYHILITFACIQVAKGDGLPEQICNRCIQEIRSIYFFQKLCQKSDVTLRQHLLTDKSPKIKEKAHTNNETNIKEGIREHGNLLLNNFKVPEQINMGSGNLLDDPFKCTNEKQISVNTETNIEVELKHNLDGQRNNYDETIAYHCKLCNEFYSDLLKYREHITKLHTQMYNCEFCKKQCKSELILARHRLTHYEEGSQQKQRNKTGIIKKRNLPRTCNICNKTFKFHSHLERHKLIHTGEKPNLCNVCGKTFAQLSYLKLHSFIHTGEKPYKCQVCKKTFAAPGTLVSHLRSHTGERPHICKICGKDFPRSGCLTLHMRIHTGEKPIECKICHHRFNERGRLNIHMRIHSGEKPYLCKDCGRSFAVKGTLKRHIRTHTGERPYVCSVCGQAFAQTGTLATHMKVHKSK